MKNIKHYYDNGVNARDGIERWKYKFKI
jgi:ATP:corrinoid adenosyltransferase